MRESWLRNQNTHLKGLFADECAVEVKSKGGTLASYSVPKNRVDFDLSATKVQVAQVGGTLWAVIPTGLPDDVVEISPEDLLPE